MPVLQIVTREHARRNHILKSSIDTEFSIQCLRNSISQFWSLRRLKVPASEWKPPWAPVFAFPARFTIFGCFSTFSVNASIHILAKLSDSSVGLGNYIYSHDKNSPFRIFALLKAFNCTLSQPRSGVDHELQC